MIQKPTGNKKPAYVNKRVLVFLVEQKQMNTQGNLTMRTQVSQLILNLGGRLAAQQLLKNAPVAAAYVSQYRLMNEHITHYYDNRYRLFQDGHWINAGIQQVTSIKNNALFTIHCEIRDIHTELANLPAVLPEIKKPICGQCAKNLNLLSQSQDRVVRQAQENIDKCNSRYWWRVSAVVSIFVNMVLAVVVGQGWLL